MAKTKSKLVKSTKKVNKYSKLLSLATKELVDKKKTLIKAERSLATAKRNHDELIAEVARLDMVERSLKALVEGTEPPTNVKYVYNYPQWVWYPAVYQTPYIPYIPGYTTSNLTGASSNVFNGVNTFNSDFNGVNTFNSDSLATGGATNTTTCASLPSDSSFAWINNENSTLTANNISASAASSGITVDLSSYANAEDSQTKTLEPEYLELATNTVTATVS